MGQSFEITRSGHRIVLVELLLVPPNVIPRCLGIGEGPFTKLSSRREMDSVACSYTCGARRLLLNLLLWIASKL